MHSTWVEVALQEIGDIFCGQSVPAADVNSDKKGSIYITGPEQWDGRSLHVNKWTERPKRTVPEGCIFITVKGAGVGKIFPGIASAIGRDIYAYKPSPGLDREFVQHAIKHRIAQLVGEARGDIPGLSREHLADHKMALPPIAEQRRIIAKLDALFARLARARAELERTARLSGRLRRSTLTKLFSKFPNDSFERIDSLCRVGTGSTPKRGEPRYYADGTIPWITSGVVNQRIVREPTELITEAALKETNCKLFPRGSLIVALYGEGKTRGKVARLAISAATNQALAVLFDFSARIDPEWVALFLEARYEETRAEAAGGVQPNLNLGIIKAIKLPVPSLEEQRSAIRDMQKAFAGADRFEAEAARARAMLSRLEAAILAKAFKGQLVPQDPNDEPASVLLERIKVARAKELPPQPN